MIRRILKSILVLVLTTLLTAGRVLSQDNGTEFGVMNDLTVLGVQGDYLDPDVEIKGFTVFGATQTAYTANISSGPGNVIINGVLGVSSGAYIAGASTFAYVSSITIRGANAIFINGGNTDNLLAKDAAGYLKWIDKTALGDNLGNHIATRTLTTNYGINASTITVSTLTVNNTLYGSTGTFTGYLNANAYLVNNSTMVRILPGTDSIAYGVYAGTSNLAGGNYNVFIGNYAGTSNTDGDYNTANGYAALYNNTTGWDNTANGAWALYKNTTGENNTANGAWALYDNTTGSHNTANGAGALFYNTTGNYNTANGAGALFYNTTGNYNTANGAWALYDNTTGNDNTANGARALSNNTTGSENTANGAWALYKNTTGSENTAIGYEALFYNQTGSQNTVVGAYAGGYGAGAENSFSSSTIMGAYAGYKISTGSANTLLGYGAGMELTTGSGNIVISTGATVFPSGGANNKLNIGNTIYGDLLSGNLGIGTTSPERRLQVGNSGDGTSAIANAWNTFSSIRWKENIKPIDNALDKVKKLQGVYFDWKQTKKHDVGLIAEEVGKVIPEVVDFEEDGKYAKGLDYAKLVSVLIEAIKEQQRQIEGLKKEISELKSR